MDIQEYSVSIDSEVFEELKANFDRIVNLTLGYMENKKSSYGEITVKLKVELNHGCEKKRDSDGFYEYLRPTFEHKVSSVVQAKSEASGKFFGNYELVSDEDGKYIMREIGDKQLSLEDVKSKLDEYALEVEDMKLENIKGFEYVRTCDNYVLKSVIAVSGFGGGYRLYYSDYHNYHFLKKFKTAKARNAEFNKMLAKFQKESEDHDGYDETGLKPETLYYVSDELYASREYAERHSPYGSKNI